MNQPDDITNHREYLERLRRGLKRVERVPRPRPGTEREWAAVLIALIDRGDDLHVLFTRRSDRLESHRGQVAFPGGRYDRRDPHLLAAALREAEEEVGIRPESVEVLGSFEGRHTHTSEIFVTPFVGIVHGSSELRADPVEVAEIFHVPLAALADPRYRGTYEFRRDGQTSRRPAIFYGGQVIWGLTYDFTIHLLEIIDRKL
jgi:8-oxo-dGTP pyrophosphatase MutT (NUDIX family)